jgi:hypothetical protein
MSDGIGRFVPLAEAARLLAVSSKYLREHRRTLPFVVEFSPRVLRADLDKLERWLERRRRETVDG